MSDSRLLHRLLGSVPGREQQLQVTNDDGDPRLVPFDAALVRGPGPAIGTFTPGLRRARFPAMVRIVLSASKEQQIARMFSICTCASSGTDSASPWSVSSMYHVVLSGVLGLL